MRARLSVVWAVVALVAAAASTRAETVRFRAGDQDYAVDVDGGYWEVHPDQHGLQAVAADTRSTVSGLVGTVRSHERRLDNLETAAPQTQAPPSGVNLGATPPVTSKEGSKMSPGAIVALTVGGVLAAAFMTLVVVALFQMANGGGGAARMLAAINTALTGAGGNVRFSASDGRGSQIAFNAAQFNGSQVTAPGAQAVAQAGGAPGVQGQPPNPAALAAAAAGLTRGQNPIAAPTAGQVQLVADALVAGGTNLGNAGAVDAVVAAVRAQFGF